MASKAKVRDSVSLGCLESKIDFYDLCETLSEELNEAEVKYLISALGDRIDLREIVKSMIDLV